ncbi:hypothetical protein BW261_12940 [Klebsiella aerogenes]|uniref:hypothetical protein n=1 Tax=Klebsiella aerogenes TaxID=548 RepID=UPI0009812B15|nr:hypothetical protein [Klebsiella aerogenes]OQR44812.1 hypothetical protein BW261_12940 [Klebsiella aerogenes]
MTTDITELAQRMSIERIKQIALGGTPTMGERESLAITALHFAEELKIATDAFQAAGLAQLAAEEVLEKAQTKAIEQGRTACELFDEVTALRQRIAGLEESHAQVIQSRDHYKRMSEEGLKLLAESRTVTVKLPQAVSAGGQGYQEQVERILTAAGIKWEAE